MITIKDFLEIVNYKIVGGEDYLWKCYGDSARLLDAQDSHFEASIIFDAKTQTVYEVSVHDVARDVTYAFFNRDYRDLYFKEAENRGIRVSDMFGDTEWHELEVLEDFVEKATAIVAGEDYDERIRVDIDIDDEDFVVLAREAHAQDITLNQLVEKLIEEEIRRRIGD